MPGQLYVCRDAQALGLQFYGVMDGTRLIGFSGGAELYV